MFLQYMLNGKQQNSFKHFSFKVTMNLRSQQKTLEGHGRKKSLPVIPSSGPEVNSNSSRGHRTWSTCDCSLSPLKTCPEPS